MEKETITISIEEYKELLNIKSDKDFEDEEYKREQAEKEQEAACQTLKKKLFKLCKENGEACEVINSIIELDPNLVCQVFDNYSPLEVPGALLDFMEGQDYQDQVTGKTFTLSEWLDFFHNFEDYNTVDTLHERCTELYSQKQELLNKLQELLRES